jgi:rhodanese-related sulfurtransferase
MARWLAKLTLNQKLGLLALALGAVAIFARVAPGETITLDAKELLTSVARGEDHVAPAELAAWIVEGRADYRLVDIRDPKAYAEYHIPTAENVPLATLLDGSLGRTEKIVLYGQGGIHAAQAWTALKGRGYTHAYTLLEGLDAWKDEVLFPAMPQNPSPLEQARFEKSAQLAKFFGGQPRAAAAPGAEPSALPTQSVPAAATPAVAAPTLPAGAGGGPKKKREGC